MLRKKYQAQRQRITLQVLQHAPKHFQLLRCDRLTQKPILNLDSLGQARRQHTSLPMTTAH